jgi:hypothetical protein
MTTSTDPPGETAESLPPWLFLLRVAWVAIELLAVYLLARQGDLFFYQGF